MTIGPEDYIFKENESENIALYFIEQGEIELLLEGRTKTSKTTLLTTIKSGAWFGEYSFFSG